MNEEKDTIKIKLDAIRIQIHDLDDVIESIQGENYKAIGILAISILLYVILFDKSLNLGPLSFLAFTMFNFTAIGISAMNIVARKVKIHINVDEIFDKPPQFDYETYLNYKHNTLRITYKNAKILLENKSDLNVASLIFLILSLGSFVILTKLN
jgi:hypothetical protein